MAQYHLEQAVFKGLQLSVDRKRFPDLYCADGQNFFVDVDGPVSGFGRQWRINQRIEEPLGVQSLKNITEDDVYYFLGNCIAKWDNTMRTLLPVYRHAARTAFWPWTRAVCGDVIYFCNKEIGIVYFDSVTGIFKQLVSAHLPDTPLAICTAGGRLFIVGEDFVVWSDIDDGSDTGLAPSTTTGAGFQSLSILSARSRPVMCLPYADGVLIYTSVGIMKSELRENTPNPFRHRVLSRAHRVLNPWAVVSLVDDARAASESHVFMTPKGLFQTTGRELPVPWQQIASEYFFRTLFPTLDIATRESMTVRLDNSPLSGWFSVSISQDGPPGTYTKTFVHYPTTDDWGVLNRTHTGFVEFVLDEEFMYGTVDAFGSIATFEASDTERVFPVETDFQFEMPFPYDMPAQYSGLGAVSIMPTCFVATAQDMRFVTQAGVWDNAYEVDTFYSSALVSVSEAEEGTRDTAPYIMTAAFDSRTAIIRMGVTTMTWADESLDAYLLIGPIRLPENPQVATDLLTQLQYMQIDMVAGNINDTEEDYIAFQSDLIVDWNTETGEEDWGQTASAGSEYHPEFIGTLDGYSTWTVDDFEQRLEPALIDDADATRQYAGVVSGMYLYLKINADEVGESFHLKHLRYTITSAGRLF